MTTITIDRAILDRLIDAWDSTVLPKSRDGMMQERMEDLRAALAAPATAPEPICTKCGDVITAHDPGLCGCCLSTRNAIQPSGPAWHDAPTKPGLWLCTDGMSYTFSPAKVRDYKPIFKCRWFGPIPPEDAK